MILMLSAFFPFIVAAAVALVLVVLRVCSLRSAARRKAAGKDPAPGPQFVNVIDWTRRR